MKRATLPDYGFIDGLNIDKHQFNPGADRSEPAQLSLSRADLKNLPSIGDNPARDERVVEQMREVRVAKGVGGRAVGYLLIGPEDAETVKFQGFGWGGDAAHPVAIGELQALAASDPDSQWLIINTPGSGKTDALPKSITKQLRKTGSYRGLGEHYATAVGSVLEGRQVELRGHSLGGRIALGMAPYIEDGVDSLIINDPTGSKKMSLGKIAQKFILEEGRHLSRYIEAGFDPEATRRQKTPAKGVENSFSKMWQMLAIDPIALTRESLESDLREALPAVKREIRILSPERSALNDWRAISAIMGRVLSDTETSANLEQWVLKGHTHSFMAVAPTIEALLYQSQPEESDGTA